MVLLLARIGLAAGGVAWRGCGQIVCVTRCVGVVPFACVCRHLCLVCPSFSSFDPTTPSPRLTNTESVVHHHHHHHQRPPNRSLPSTVNIIPVSTTDYTLTIIANLNHSFHHERETFPSYLYSQHPSIPRHVCLTLSRSNSPKSSAAICL
jgi:hypothetical protein